MLFVNMESRHKRFVIQFWVSRYYCQITQYCREILLFYLIFDTLI